MTEKPKTLTDDELKKIIIETRRTLRFAKDFARALETAYEKFSELTLFYTHSPHRKPLTDEEIIILSKSAGVYLKVNDDSDLIFARAIERAHGIGEKE